MNSLMIAKRYKPMVFSLLICLLVSLVTACNREPIPDVVFHDLTLSPTEVVTLPTPTLSPTPTATPTRTPEPLTFFISTLVSDGVVAQDQLGFIEVSHDPDAALWFGPESDAPDGDTLSSSTWVYALAAPFPTLVDDIPLTDLQAYWLGSAEGNLASVSRLYVPEDLAWALDDLWGFPDPALVETYLHEVDVDTLWETNAWVMLPFEALQPKLKVISVDGVSPLFKDFEVSNYPLVIEYRLVHNQNSFESPLNADVIATLENAIQPGNRDPDKMTTLVMTGVTALVRAIAYRMELYGVLYPGEKIRDWLREADLAHISNEVSFYEDCPFPDPTSRRLLFCSDPKYIELLYDVGADIIELTGNHNNDALYMYGHDAVPFTLDLYEQYGMVYFGGGRDLADAKSPLKMTHNGNQLAFVGCNAFGPDFAWASEDGGGAAPCEDYQWMADEITHLRSEGYLPIATFQYYEDYYDFAADHHVRDFGLMAEAGAVIVNGSQAHRPKAMAFAHDAFIDYGLGNFFFDQRWTIDMYGNVVHQTSWEIIQRHTFYDGWHLSTELLTAMLEDFAQPRPMTPAEREEFLTELFQASGWISR